MPNGNMFWTIILMFAFLVLINTFLFPGGKGNSVVETDYGSFISDVDSGRVYDVVIDGDKVMYSKNAPLSYQERLKGQRDTTYITGAISDPDFVSRLSSAKSPGKGGKIRFVKKLDKERSPLLDFILWWILPGMLMYWVFSSAIKRIGGMAKGGSGMGNFMQFGQSGAKVYAENDIKTRFSDVAGQDEAKDGLMEVVDFLHNPDKYNEVGAHLPKGVLLVGPPGTGKTLIARAVAGEAGVPFFSMSGSEFVQMFVGMGAAKVRDLFSQAQAKAPCIVFIDEIDAIGKSLDKALLRPGRFDRRVQMELPDLQGRKAILQVHLKDIRHEDIDLDLIGRATAGSSGAELANIVNEAALRAVRLGKKAATTEDLEESVEVVMAGEQRKNAVISAEEKRIIAYHEIGHAMVAAAQNNSAPVQKITIIPRTSGALGYTMQVDEGEKFLYSKDYLLNRLATLTGGRVAEEVICHTCTTGASNDIEKATQMARSMITTYGMSDKYGMMALETQGNSYLGGSSRLACSDETAADIDTEVREMIAEAKKKATEIIGSHLDKMHKCAEYLLEKETITGEEFMKIFNS